MKSHSATFFALALLIGLCLPAYAQQSDPLIVIHTGSHYIWYCNQSVWNDHQLDIARYFDYADKALAQTVKDWGVPAPKRRYSLWVNPSHGLGAFATGDIAEVHALTMEDSPGIGVGIDCFSYTANKIHGYFGYTFITHETCNNLTGQLVSGGWPRNWWADDISPFPAMTAVQVETEVAPPGIAIAHAHEFVNDKLYQMFYQIRAKYGWSLFHNMFAALKSDHIDFSHLDNGANPSPILTAYVAAYIVLGSNDTLDALDAFFAPIVPGYDKAKTEQVIQARDRWRHHQLEDGAYHDGSYLSSPD